jgi:hypothetical protein
MGVMLLAPEDGVPRRDPFLIVDESLTVQAISRLAEAVLSVDEPAGVSVLLDEFLTAAGEDQQPAELERLVRLAAAGRPSPETLEVRTTRDPPAWFTVRVTTCGPPVGALLIFSPVRTRLAARSPARRGVPEPDRRRGDHSAQSPASSRAADSDRGQATSPEKTLERIASMLIVAGQRIANVGEDHIEAALTEVAGLRDELDRTERDLVSLARRSGRTWAQIGANLNIIVPREPDIDVGAGLRHAHHRRPSEGSAGAHAPTPMHHATPRSTHSR